MGKLPYIPDKKMYAAVMGACSYIRETGWFNKATEYYADKYDVDVDELRKYIRIAQGRGQKQKNASKPKRKFYYYAIEFSVGGERNGYDYFVEEYAQFEVIKAVNEGNAWQRVFDEHSIDPCSEYGAIPHSGRTEVFESKQDAIKTVRKWKAERDALREKLRQTE